MSHAKSLTAARRRRLLGFHAAAWVVFLSALLSAEAGPATQQQDDLFTAAPPSRVAAMPEAARRQPDEVIRQRYVTVNLAYFRSRVLAARRGGRAPRGVAVTLFDDVRLTLDPTNVRRNADGVYIWESGVEAKTWGRATIALSGTAATGTIEVDDKIYEINTVFKGIISISEIDRRKFKDELPPIPRPAAQPPAASGRAGARRAARPRPGRVGAAASTLTLSVLVVLPQAYFGNVCFDFSTNLAYKASATENLNDVFGFFPTGVGAVVNVYCTFYKPKGGDLEDDLGWVSSDAAVAAARDKFGADLVSLQVPDADGCGRGYFNGPPVTAAAESRAFSVVKWSCARSNYTLAHEIGHNMGMRHDRIDQKAEQSPYCNFGYIAAGDAFRTVMSYGPSCGGCPRRGTYSSPQFKDFKFGDHILHTGPYGVACDAPPDGNGNYPRANNLAQFVAAAPVVSAFR